jgi:hypothetical protein
MYVESIYNYFHDFRTPVKYATMTIKIGIENSWSLKLCQTQQVGMESLSFTTSMQITKNEGYPAYQ